MTLADATTLALKGHSISDIKEIGELAKSNPDVLNLAKAGTKLSDLKELIALVDPGEEDPGNSTDPEPGESDPTPEPDYKKLYEEQTSKIAELEKTVSNIQEQNNRKNNSGNVTEKDDIDILLDIFNETH